MSSHEKHLPLQGAGFPPKSEILSNLRCLCLEAAAYAVNPLNPK
ncbi:hypothetical protein BACCOPRO_01081 [Phocaeicola coprophilus DSM 18228 = JCM 13818]|uniref:Uncharacterized protein n=1 Tax=Phocaeicola coprophilus DSM 18228 = JCM 13818 TaxID=547042 RepID=S0FAP7_9BACT|nr:hypothetical protein BACCOPRO_01081 [Phocaeicola coprophilus DSM 18228 = JCM 13818]